jgi:arylsulfatase A-like enzyme
MSAGRSSLNRREFLGAAGVAAVLPGVARGSAAPQRRPNVLYIMTDQQHWGMMSCAGNKYLRTPAMDSLMKTGMRFELAYSANPVSLPSRYAMMSGRMPSNVNVKANQCGKKATVTQTMLKQSMGHLFRKAGYETAYGGKTHLPKGMSPESMGFDFICKDQRDRLADDCAAFLKRKHSKPFLLVASLINPHDICYMAIRDVDMGDACAPKPLEVALRMPKGVSREEFFRTHCPPLPPNFEPQPQEPEIVETGLFTRTFKKKARDNWSPEQWRAHRWAYCRLTEKVDSQVAVVLRALRQAGLEDDTLVIFSSDHGDMDSAHRLEHKTMLYDEAARVPLIVSYPGRTKAGLVDRKHLVSSGLDLLPTMCDFAGIAPPADLPGRSIRALTEGRTVKDWPDQIVVEGEFGRMVRTARYKYSIYESGRHREQLIDMQADPGEMTNLADKKELSDILAAHRQRLAKWVKQVDDRIGAKYIIP